jgi:transmembrane sensor
MSSESQQDGRALEEAWRWLGRLSTPAVSTQTIEDFFTWKRKPENAAAYLTAEKMHRLSGSAASSPIVQSTLADIDARRAARTGARARPAPAVLGWAAAGALGTVLLVAVVSSSGLLAGAKVYRTAVGERRSITLPDGSRLDLDTDTRLSVRLTDKLRAVSLQRGQALFDVAHDAKRPFRVTADTAQIDDLGTRFDVRRDPDGVRVTLIAGSASVSTLGAERAGLTLTPGQQVTAGRLISTPRLVDAAAATSWTGGHLIFDDTPLASAVMEVNRYAKIKVGLSDQSLETMRVSGVFDTTDTEAFVKGVCQLLNLKASAAGGLILLKAKVPAAPV